MAKDYYALLGVAKGATQDEIKKAYRTLAHTHHPDKKGGDEAKFKEINEAYSVLGDAEKRRQYDQFGQTFQGQGGGRSGAPGFDFSGFGSQGFDFGGAGFEDLFTDLFSGGGGGGRRRGQERGSDIQVDVTLTFEEMVRGAEREISLRKLVNCHTCHGTGGAPGAKRDTCSECQGKGSIRKTVNTILGAFAQTAECTRCHGTGHTYSANCKECRGSGRIQETVNKRVNIPAGIENGQALSLQGEGAAGEHGAPAGDLFIVVHVEPHKHFVRHGDDIVTEVNVRFDQLVLGDKIGVMTVDGEVSMKVPAGTEPGEVFRVKGKGVPHLGRHGRGDHLVKIKITIPKHLSGEKKRLVEALRESE